MAHEMATNQPAIAGICVQLQNDRLSFIHFQSKQTNCNGTHIRTYIRQRERLDCVFVFYVHSKNIQVARFIYRMVWCAHIKQFVRQFLLFWLVFFSGIDLFGDHTSCISIYNSWNNICIAFIAYVGPRTINAMFTWMFPSLVSGLLYHPCMHGMAWHGMHASANRVKT